MGAYQQAINDKKTAANILLPLIEFEFSLVGDDSPVLVQSVRNYEQLNVIHNICKKHNWATVYGIRQRGDDYTFRISKTGLKEIYELAGPFVSKKRNVWSELLIERIGKKGGFMGRNESTEKKVFKVIQSNKKKLWTTGDLCLKCRLTPGTIRTGVRILQKKRMIKKKRKGKSIFFRYNG